MHVASVFTGPRTASLAAGSSCQGPGHQEVMGEMLRQAETQCHKKARRLVWLEAIKPVFAVSPFTSLQPLLHCNVTCCNRDDDSCTIQGVCEPGLHPEQALSASDSKYYLHRYSAQMCCLHRFWASRPCDSLAS